MLNTLLFLWVLLPHQGSPQKGKHGSPLLPDPRPQVARDSSPGPSPDTVLSTSLSSTLHPSPSLQGILLSWGIVLTQDVFSLTLLPLQFPLQPRLLHTKIRDSFYFPLPPLSHPFPEAMSTAEPDCWNGKRVGKEGNTVGKKYQFVF